MKVGMITDSLAGLSLVEVLRVAGDLGISTFEFGCGNWSAAPHLDLAVMTESPQRRQEFCALLRDHGVSISALNCAGNPLHPGPTGEQHHHITLRTIELAGLLEVDRVVLMSGLPGGPGDANPNWITTDWPLECNDILTYQWEENLIPYWRRLAGYASSLGVSKLCIEPHGHQCVYNVRTLLKLRDAVGEVVGANYDPSHPIWMGADPLSAIAKLGEAIYHVHVKDTRIEAERAAVDGLLDPTSPVQHTHRTWNYVTLGYGHDDAWWRGFCAALRAVGYDDVLSIEHEDVTLPALEGVRKSVECMRRIGIVS